MLIIYMRTNKFNEYKNGRSFILQIKNFLGGPVKIYIGELFHFPLCPKVLANEINELFTIINLVYVTSEVIFLTRLKFAIQTNIVSQIIQFAITS